MNWGMVKKEIVIVFKKIKKGERDG